MRYYAARNLFVCLRYAPIKTLFFAFLFLMMLLGIQNIADYQNSEPKENHTELTQEQIEFGSWMLTEFNKPVEEKDYSDVPVYNWDYETYPSASGF